MAKAYSSRAANNLRRGDHACVIYSSLEELTGIVSAYLAEGLRRGERCWYVAADDEAAAVREALRARRVSVDAETLRGALRLIPSTEAYLIRGHFHPEDTMKVFSDAIEQALADGFTGFRAAAEMSWALDPRAGTDRLAAYEAMLRTLFSSCPATGLCLYHRESMPLPVLSAALATHPIARLDGQFDVNPLYDARVNGAADVDTRKTASHLKRFGAR